VTQIERQWCAAITEIGCICCLLFHSAPRTPGAVHHLLRSGRRIGHLDTICLCDPGHHQNPPAKSGKVSRHPSKARFEAAYTSEEVLLQRTRELVERHVGLKVAAMDGNAQRRWREYKTGRSVGRASSHCEGESDGAEACGDAIRAEFGIGEKE